MKKFLLLMSAVLFSAMTFAQEAKPTEKTWKPYVTASYSFTNSVDEMVKETSFFAVEYGMTKENLGLFGSVGRGNTLGTFAKDDQLDNYWVELGASYTQKIGVVDVYGMLGVGSYLKSNGIFVEYGMGMSHAVSDKIALGGKVTNWDGTWFVSPTITLSL